MRGGTSTAVGAMLAAIGIAAIYLSLRLPFGSLAEPGPAFIPALWSVLLTAFSAAAIVESRRSARGADHAERDPGRPRVLAILATCVGIVLLWDAAGFVATVAAAAFVLLAAVERRPPLVSAFFAVGLSAGSYLLFAWALDVPLPRSPLGW